MFDVDDGCTQRRTDQRSYVRAKDIGHNILNGGYNSQIELSEILHVAVIGGRAPRKIFGKDTARLAGRREKEWREKRYAKRYGLAGAERYGGKRHSKHVEVIVWLPRIAGRFSSAFCAATKET